MDTLKNLFNRKIFWRKDNNSNSEFIYFEDDNKFVLRINDFPEEIMFTISDDTSSIDFEDLPELWSIEGM